jgi:hypothetical protein
VVDWLLAGDRDEMPGPREGPIGIRRSRNLTPMVLSRVGIAIRGTLPPDDR